MSQNIVWVLGAGFSKPLGGPLLGDLFTAASAGNLDARYPPEKYPAIRGPAAGLVRALYRWGLGETVRLGLGVPELIGERVWENAEEFLDYLDTAVALGSGSPGWKRLVPIIKQYAFGVNARQPAEIHISFDEQGHHIADTARRLMAAECSAFMPDLRQGQPSFERWTPYQRWWRQVQLGQTIISFNYDLVIERLGTEEPRKLFVVPPGFADQLPEAKVPLIKLHGSLDWRRVPGSGVADTYQTGQAEDFAVQCEDYELAIASPGLTKQRLVKDDFASLWVHAEKALASADAIVFVGYRFPPTDSEALSRLLGAIGRNERPFLPLHTVLGPRKSDDVGRLHSLLRYAARVQRRQPIGRASPHGLSDAAQRGERSYMLVSQALWSQDFLLVAKSHELLQPYLVQWE